MSNYIKKYASEEYVRERISESQADWNINDEDATGYVKNRTHYEIGEVVLFDEDITLPETNVGLEWRSCYRFDNPLEFEIGKTYIISWGDYEQSVVFDSTGLAFFRMDDDTSQNYVISTTYFEIQYPVSLSGRLTIKQPSEVKQIDQKFIPNVDWNVNDETAAGYIKNRTHYAIAETTVIPETETTFALPCWDLKLADMKARLILGAKYHLVLTYVEKNADFINGVYECVETDKGLSIIVPTSDVDFVPIPGTGTTHTEWLFYSFNNALYIYETGYGAGTDQAWESRISLIAEERIKQLDEKYIPDTIARTSDIPQEVVTVTVTNDVADKTATEIMELVNAGKHVRVLYMDITLEPTYITNEGALFRTSIPGEFVDDNAISEAIMYLQINDDGTVLMTGENASASINYVNEIAENIVQSDWSQSDETALDYIKNRTHYEENVEEILVDESIYCTGYGAFSAPITFIEGASYTLYFRDTNCGTVTYTSSLGNNVVFGGEYDCSISSSGITASKNTPDGSYAVKLICSYNQIHQLDEKYIPDTIARQIDIDNAKNDLLNGAGEAYDTLKELGDLINENADALQALETVATGKADKVHNHDDLYYTKTEIDAFELITVDDIDAICSANITVATSEVKF